MLTQTQLQNAFRVYFEEINRCNSSQCYWALLHLVIIIPDICGALESENGGATPNNYMNWCKRFLQDVLVSPEEWYEIRCKLLHQGRSKVARGRYQGFSFTQPGMENSNSHGKVIDDFLCLDVDKMAKQMMDALRQWFNELENDPNSPSSQNVEKNLPSLVKEKPPTTITATGQTIYLATTTSTFKA